VGLLAIGIARRAQRESPLTLGRPGTRPGVVRAGRVLGIVGLCIALAGVVSLAVYGLLEYAGTRD
jgi:hypothetical protein